MTNVSKTDSNSVSEPYSNHNLAAEGGTPMSVNRLTQGTGVPSQETITRNVLGLREAGVTLQENATTSASNADLPKATTTNSVHTYLDEGVKLSDSELEDLCDKESITDPVQVQQSLDYANAQADLHRQDQPQRYKYATRSDFDIIKIERKCTPKMTASISGLKTEDFPDFPNGGATAAKGKRTKMQDSYLATRLSVDSERSFPIVGVFDGHGEEGEKYSSFVKENIVQDLKAELAQCNLGDLSETRNALFAGMDFLGEKVKAYYGYDNGGTTACVAVVLDDGDSKTIWALNVGDSRAVVGHKDGTCTQLTTDHNASDLFDEAKITTWMMKKGYTSRSIIVDSENECDDEIQGILKPGKKKVVKNYQKGEQVLNATFQQTPGSNKERFGVQQAKVTCQNSEVYRDLGERLLPHTPTITTHKITSNTAFVFIGCDGIYDMLTTDEVSRIIHDKLKENPAATGTEISEHVVTAAYAAGSDDNLTAVFIPVRDLVA